MFIRRWSKKQASRSGVRTESSPLTAERPIQEGQVLTGPLFSEPMQVEAIRSNGSEKWVAGSSANGRSITEFCIFLSV